MSDSEKKSCVCFYKVADEDKGLGIEEQGQYILKKPPVCHKTNKQP